MTKRAYAVVGATGTVGTSVAGELLARGHEVRAIGRSAEKLAKLSQRGAKPFAGDFASVSMLAEAFTEAAGVFAFLPPGYEHPDLGAHQDRVGEAIVEALRRSKASRVVQLSSLGAQHQGGTGPIAGLHRQEQRLREVPGLDVVNLRAGTFLENHLVAIPGLKAEGVFGGPIRGDRPIAMVSARDVGTKAAGLLDALAFRGRSDLELSGPRDVSFDEAARILGAAIGKPDLRYTRLPWEQVEAALASAGSSPRNVRLFLEMFRAIDEGRVAPTHPPGPEESGRTTIEAFARDVFAPAWRAA